MDYYQFVAELHPNLVGTFDYLKGMDNMGPFNISGVGGRKYDEQGKGGVDVTTVII